MIMMIMMNMSICMENSFFAFAPSLSFQPFQATLPSLPAIIQLAKAFAHATTQHPLPHQRINASFADGIKYGTTSHPDTPLPLPVCPAVMW